MHRARANGVEFAYLEEGTGPLVLLLHGFPDTPHSWVATRPALAAAGFCAVSPFMRGYAPTEIPADGDYRGDTLARDVGALIETLGEKSAIVVGHDWGAAAAYGCAVTHPDRVRFLVTVAIPHPASIRPSPLLLWRVRHFLTLRGRGAPARIRAGNYVEIDELVRRWSPDWNFSPADTEAVKKAFAIPGCLEAALGYYRAIGPRIPKSQRGRIRMPAVAFAGASDSVLSVVDYERARTWYLDRYEVVTLPGGHFLHREHPEQFNRELISRLRAHVG